jgi:hypothetical protein
VTDRQVSALEFGGPLIKGNLPRRCRAGTAGNVESPGGLSLPGAPRSVREPLDSYGSRWKHLQPWVAGPQNRLWPEFNLLGDAERIVNVDPMITDRTFQLRVP